MNLTNCEVETNNIQSLPDAPATSPEELKKLFDKAGGDLKEYINTTLIPEITKQMNDELTAYKKEIDTRILADNKKRYHIGKIIIETSNINPQTYLGFGTWEYWGAGRVPVGIDMAQEEFNEVEKIGGEKVHQLTEEELAKHKHKGLTWLGDEIQQSITLNQGNEDLGYNLPYNSKLNSGSEVSIHTRYSGENKAHNNLQPYITCYMWKRIA